MQFCHVTVSPVVTFSLQKLLWQKFPRTFSPFFSGTKMRELVQVYNFEIFFWSCVQLSTFFFQLHHVALLSAIVSGNVLAAQHRLSVYLIRINRWNSYKVVRLFRWRINQQQMVVFLFCCVEDRFHWLSTLTKFNRYLSSIDSWTKQYWLGFLTAFHYMKMKSLWYGEHMQLYFRKYNNHVDQSKYF